MSIDEIYKNLDYLEESIRLQYTNFIYRNYDDVREKTSYAEVFSRIKSQEPIEYIFHLAEFHGLKLYVDKRVLIPRPETEEIVDKTLEFLKQNPNEDFTIIDVGTGSGCIGLAIASEFKIHTLTGTSSSNFKKIIGIDVSGSALEVARINRDQLGLNGEMDFIEADFRDFDFSQYENLIILANLPYIPNSRKLQESVEQFEPHLALFGGEKGDELIHDLKSKVSNLKSLKLIILEVDNGLITRNP